MKLAEALAERSDCQVRIEDLKKRIVRSARVQEGEKPAEDSASLLKENWSAQLTAPTHARLSTADRLSPMRSPIAIPPARSVISSPPLQKQLVRGRIAIQNRK